MSDAELRSLERAALASGDQDDRRRWRQALVASGRDAGLEIGDVVLARHDPLLGEGGSEFCDDYPAVLWEITSEDFTESWCRMWRPDLVDSARYGARVLGLVALPPIRMAAVFWPCVQQHVRLVAPNAWSRGVVLQERYLDSAVYRHNHFDYGPSTTAVVEPGDDPEGWVRVISPALGPWPLEGWQETSCLSWGQLCEAHPALVRRPPAVRPASLASGPLTLTAGRAAGTGIGAPFYLVGGQGTPENAARSRRPPGGYDTRMVSRQPRRPRAPGARRRGGRQRGG